MARSVRQASGIWWATVWCESVNGGPTVPDGAIETMRFDTEAQARKWAAANEARVINQWMAQQAWEAGASVIEQAWEPYFAIWAEFGFPSDDVNHDALSDAFRHGG